MAVKTRKRGYGWRPDKPDFRDYPFMEPNVFTAINNLASNISLRAHCPPVLDQGQLGSCTAHAIAEAIEFDRMKQKLRLWTPSRLFIYYNERDMEGTVKEDAGAEIRDGIKSISKLGAPPESDWSYTISKFARKPVKKAYTDALKHKSVTYKRIDTADVATLDQRLQAMKTCIGSGYPFTGGFSVYESFESDNVAKTGVVPMPSKSESVIGGHAVLFIAFDDATGRFTCQNSWGKEWGDDGFFTIPYEYVGNSDLCNDLWVINVTQ